MKRVAPHPDPLPTKGRGKKSNKSVKWYLLPKWEGEDDGENQDEILVSCLI